MNKGKFKLLGVTATVLFMMTSVANAQLMMELSDTADFSGSVVSAADGDADGVVSISSSLGSFFVNVLTGLGSPAIGDAFVDELDLNSVNVSGDAGTIYMRLTETGLNKGTAHYAAGFGGTTDGSVSFQSYVDGSNSAFGMGTLLNDSGDMTGAYSAVSGGEISMEGPYSMSIYAAITHSGRGVSSFDYNIKVPEPSSLALLGLGLIGAGFVSRRKAKKTA
jgi:hypothetical protein